MSELMRGARGWRGAYARWRSSWDGRVPVVTLLIAVVVGLELGFWLGRWGIPGGPGDTTRTESARLSHTQRAPEESMVSPGVRLDHCQAVHAAQSRALEALGPALARWEIHVGAMNKLTLGVISPAKAREFWDRTREGTLGDLTALAEAKEALDENAARCPAPGSRTSSRVHACASAVASRHRELERAEVALDGWRMQVRRLERLRRGESTVEEVVQVWQQGWQESRRQVAMIRDGLQTVHDDGDAACAG